MLSGNTPDITSTINRVEAQPEFPMKKSILYDLRRKPHPEGAQKAIEALKQVRKNRPEEWTSELDGVLQELLLAAGES